MTSVAVAQQLRPEVETLWDYNQMHHQLRPTDVGIGLGGHDLGVAVHIANLYHRGLFPLVVFTGANAPTTVERFPRGEAVHFREKAIELDVPPEVILVEPDATNTGENIDYTRDLLRDRTSVQSVLLVSRPYQQRRSYAICRKRWPEVDVLCSSSAQPLDEYVSEIGDADRVVNMLVGDTQRVWVYAAKGWAIEQDVPDRVHEAYTRLVDAGFNERLLPE
ncbi:YdcF family protein [Nocardia takedensis]|uniref:YdcF family protein n=1 Tax=Nocardia takedensis TaxID=259390 RepID=UPI0003007CDB|nr:YdcF family protein [Nocardia takedensis]